MADDATPKAPPAKNSLPSELIMSARWDQLLERVVLNSGAGALMGLAASLIAKLLGRHRWIAYVGLLVILYVALEMIWRGADEVWPVVSAMVQ